MFEAQAIAIEIEKIVPNRPMTHDLFKSFASNFDFTLEEIVISDLKEGVFFAKIVCNDGTHTTEIDARPSDAIAIGLRFSVPIYTYESVLSEAGIVLTEEESESAAESSEAQTKEKSNKPLDEQLKDLSFDKLTKLLEETLKKEDYEKAALVRDEMNRRN